MALSKYYSLDQLTRSNTAIRKAIDNTPDEDQKENLRQLAINVLDPITDMIQQRLVINSGFRSLKLNKVIGGSRNSQHTKGMAADIESPPVHNAALFAAIAHSSIPYDQLIYEFDGAWIHVSYNPSGGRRQLLTASKENGKTVYKVIALTDLPKG